LRAVHKGSPHPAALRSADLPRARGRFDTLSFPSPLRGRVREGDAYGIAAAEKFRHV